MVQLLKMLTMSDEERFCNLKSAIGKNYLQ